MERRVKMTWAGAAESVCHLATIPMSVMAMVQGMLFIVRMSEIEVEEAARAALEQTERENNGALLVAGMFLLVAAARALMAFRRRNEGKLVFVTSLVQTGIFLACAVVPLAAGLNEKTMFLSPLLYGAAIILGRIVSVIRDRRARNVILCLVQSLVVGYCALALMTTAIVIACLSLFFIMRFIFVGIDVRTLTRIIRKTYAAEIIFGLVLLMMTFSFLLTVVEPNMPGYLDALWYCFALVTTIGFGDVTAVTLPGRILSAILGIYGIVVVALITSIIVNFYGEMKKENKPEPEEADGKNPAADAGEEN